jgi:hypothetical protein
MGRSSWPLMGSGWSGRAPPGFVRRVAGRAGITKRFGPHTHTAARVHHRQFRRRVALGDVQEAASHADPHDDALRPHPRGLDRHATYAYLAGAAR